MSSINEKIKDIFRRIDTAAHGQNNTNCWSEADINLSAPDGMDYWDWIEQASNEALSEADTLTARVAELEAAILAYKESGTTGNQHKMFELLEAKS